MSALDFEYLDVQQRADGVLELTIQRPNSLNALHRDLLGELNSLARILQEDDSVRCVIVTGAGKAFVAGADIEVMSGLDTQQARAFSILGHQAFRALEALPMPVLAAVNGFALGGGCELALVCDVIYASSQAKFGQPEVNLGLIPGFGGTVRLQKKIGVVAASEWLFSGNLYSAEEAQRVGLVSRVLEPDELLEHVRGVAARIASRGPMAVREAKRLMRVAALEGERAALVQEQDAFGQLFNTDDVREGMQAFLEKREARFTGR